MCGSAGVGSMCWQGSVSCVCVCIVVYMSMCMVIYGG